MNLRLLKSKIKSIANVGQITKAMQLVSAVKMKKGQALAQEGKPYRATLELTMKKVIASSYLDEHPLMKAKDTTSKTLAIIVSSNKGLCGVFNFNLFKFVDSVIKEQLTNYEFVVIGAKAQQFLFHYGGTVIADFSNKLPFVDNTTAIFDLVVKRFQSGQIAKVELFFNQFVSSLVYKPVRKILLPLDVSSFYKQKELQQKKDYLVEPDALPVLNGLFSFFIESQIRGAIIESEASEHSARMIAMKNATDNTKDLVYRLTLLRNSLRQTKITNELLDMNTARLAVA